MHREISHTHEAFHQERNLSLYLLTGLIGLLIAADLWPALVSWLNLESLPTWKREFYGSYRFALLAAVLGGARVLYGSIDSLLSGRLGADLALAIAAIAAILIGEPLVAAEVVFVGMVGECLESFTFERTQRALRQIVEIQPRRCWLLRDGQEVRVLTTELQVGDRVVVKPGARIPVDGVVLDGRSALDQSALTGESLPIDKGPGDEVLAGSLNQFGALTIEAKRVAEQTVVGRVIELTSRALKDKAPLERTADRLARWFLPAVLALAALTFLGCLLFTYGPLAPAGKRIADFAAAVRFSIYPTLAVLVVACPCALILATPAAVIAALGRLAGTGVLIKGGAALERLATVQAFAFDKTGTLTEGKLELGDVMPIADVPPALLLQAAATAEQRSEHPLAQVILNAAKSQNIKPDELADFQAHPGAGVTARTTATPPLTITIGTRRLIEEKKIALPAAAVAALERLDSTGQTALLVALDEIVIGVIGARDRVRPEAADVVTQLRNRGVTDIALLTGDRPGAARTVAAAVGITNVHAELLPEQKADFVSSEQRLETREQKSETNQSLISDHGSLISNHRSLRTAFVGDGVNDAPALARAAVGLAIGGSGSDVAAEAGDVVLMGDPLRPLPLLLSLSRQTVRIIRQNILIFAFVINGLGILVTAWLWPLLLPVEWAPLAGVVYHQIGSLLVLLNSMRLLTFERPRHPALAGLRERVLRVDSWMERNLNLDEGLHWLAHHFKLASVIGVGLLAIGYVLWGFTAIGPDEIGVVRRFGRPTADLQPGLHWVWPWPVESVLRVQPDRIRTVEVGYRVTSRPAAVPTGALGGGWGEAHRGDGVTKIPDEAVMITGDGNLVELQATVRYRIDRDRLHTYLFEVRDVDETIRAATESVLREAVAAWPFLDLLTIHRERFQEDVLRRLRQRWQANEYGPAGLGVVIDGLSLHDLHPPERVVDAFHDVARAMERRDWRVNKARAEEIRLKSDAEAEALRSVRQAQGEAEKKVLLAEAGRDGFLAREQARRQLSWTDEWRLMNEAAAAVAAGEPAGAAYQAYQQHRQRQLALLPYLTDYRLSVRGLAGALQQRDKVILDSTKVPGKRNLFLFDPELFRPPPPAILQGDRMPARSPRNEDGP